MPWHFAYPTREHEAAAQAIVEHFRPEPSVTAVLLTNSCARGKASRDSCLDLAVLVHPQTPLPQRTALQQAWAAFEGISTVVAELRRAGRYSAVHLDILDGVFQPEARDEAAGPDGFELGIGNLLVYSHALLERGDHLARLKRQWLPYYSDDLRRQRLTMVRGYCLNNLHHIAVFIPRRLYFQAFDRLYNGYREFLQALFIHRRVYPIAYNKWIHEQVVEILGLPELYPQLVRLLEIGDLESDELVAKAATVEGWLNTYAPAPET